MNVKQKQTSTYVKQKQASTYVKHKQASTYVKHKQAPTYVKQKQASYKRNIYFAITFMLGENHQLWKHSKQQF